MSIASQLARRADAFDRGPPIFGILGGMSAPPFGAVGPSSGLAASGVESIRDTIFGRLVATNVPIDRAWQIAERAADLAAQGVPLPQAVSAAEQAVTSSGPVGLGGL